RAEVPFLAGARAWLVDAAGGPVLAALVAGLALAGGAAWWRAGRRTTVLLAASGTAAYVLAAALRGPASQAVPAFLPAAALLAVLTGGVGLGASLRRSVAA